MKNPEYEKLLSPTPMEFAALMALPLDIWVNKYRNDAGEMVLLYGGADVDKPFYIAAGVAFVMLFCGIYVVAIAIQNSSQKQEKQ